MQYTQVSKTDTDTLERPLLDSDNDSTGSGVMSKGNSAEDLPATGKSGKSPSSKYNEYLAGRIYASNAPKILLETITARTATVIIALTYFFFLLGFCIDFYTTYKSFHSSNYQLTALPCGQQQNQTDNYMSCSAGPYWNATITHLDNVISVKLDVEQQNISSTIQNATDKFDITYSIALWTCYNSDGCGNHFAANSHYTDDPNVWQHVYTDNDQTLNVDLNIDVKEDGQISSLTKSLIPSLFQNQESIPTNGMVKAYFISVEYLEDPYNIFVDERNDTSRYTYYNFDVVERPRQQVVNAVTIILLFITLAVLAWYVNMLLHQKKVLSEQKWVVAYFALLVLFQNPVYCVIVFYHNAPSVQAAYASYVIGYIAQSGLFILWLLFADSINRKTNNKRLFYGPKVAIGFVIFLTGILILTFQFPGLNADEHRHTRSAVEAVANWTTRLRTEFIVFTIMYLLLIWVWTIWWFITLFMTGQKLKKLPYMSTRYIQLSYRFFSLQATLVTLYYLFQYVVVIVFITQGVTSSYDSVTLTDNINILFRQQTQLFGKTLFLTVYALIIAFLFLPSSLMAQQQGILSSLSATYVITEQEHKILVKTRKILIGSVKRNLLNQINLVGQLTGAKADVFCVDRALNLRNVAFQAYYDPPRISTASAYGEMNLDPIGYEFIDLTYNPEHEVFCFICREKATGRLVVAFRGTASKRQMEANLKYTQRAISFGDLTTSTLDHLDGLTIKPSEMDEDNRFELDSVSDDEQDVADLGLESAHGSKTALGQGYGSGNSSRTVTQQGGDDPQHPHASEGNMVSGGIKRVLQGAADVTLGVVDRAGAVVDTAAGLVTTAAVGVASKTPVLKGIVTVYVHSGFWEAYEHVRDFIHAILRRELVRNPTTVYFTGHSLGGALATFAALDVTLHTVPRVNAWLKHQEKLRLRREHEISDGYMDPRPSLLTSLSRTFTGTIAPFQHFAQSTFMPRSSTFQPEASMNQHSQHAASATASGAAGAGAAMAKPPPFVKKIKIFMYNYGSPKVGNGNFANLYDRLVPASYRVVVDGDLVAALPPQSNYTHIGTEILIDSVGAGSIIIDPSFVERWLRTHMKSSVAVHSLLVYRKGLLGIKLAAEFMRANATTKGVDPLRLALKVRAHQQIDSILDENAGIPIDLEARDAESEIADYDPPERVHSVSDEINGRVPCLPPIEERGAGGAVVMPMLSPVALEEGESKGEEVANPMNPGAALSRQASLGETMSSAERDRDYNAIHYAHDVEQMAALQSQMAAMRMPGPVRWIHAQASKRLNRGGDKESQEGASGKGFAGKSGKEGGSKKGPDFV